MRKTNYKLKNLSVPLKSRVNALKASLTLIMLMCSLTFGFGQILSESFDGATIPVGWTQEFVSGTDVWSTVATNGNSTISPHSGAKMAEFRNSNTTNATKLVTPSMDLSATSNPQLTFYYANANWLGDVDELRVYYKTSAAGSWVQLGSDYITEKASWEKVVLTLPNASADYYVAFEATSNWARGLDLDDVSVIDLVGCTGTPIAGTVFDMSVCSGVNFTLSSVGASAPATGLTRIWESSSDNATWSSIPGSGNDSYTVVGGVSSTMYYRYILACNITAADTSAVVTVTLKPANQCYCTPVYTYGCSSGDMIDDFSITGLNSTSISDLATDCSGGYDDRTSMAAVDLMQGNSYTALVKTQTSGDNCAIWIDFNDNGIFEGTESVGTLSGMSSSGTSNVPVSISSTASTGLHRMRVMVAYGGAVASYDACNSTGIQWGETHDYMVNILALPSCSGIPTAGTVSDISTCSGIDFTLTSVGATVPANGLTKTWESSTDNVTWTPIASSGSDSYTVVGGVTTTMYYRYILACNITDADTSAVVTVTLKPTNQCYCTPSGINASYFIKDFSTTGGILNVSKLGSGYSTGGYGDFTTDTVSQMRTNVVNFSGAYSAANTYGTKIWVDWNQNGTFDATELVYSTISYSNTSTGSFTVPNNALVGATRMRIGINYSSSTGPANACFTGISGEFEDYTFKVIPLPECSGQPTAGSVTTPMGVCSGVTFNLATTGSTTPSNNLNGIWQSSPAGANTWTDIVGATGSSYSLTGGVTSATDFRYILNCANSSLADTSSILSVTMKAFNQCYCTPATTGTRFINDFSTTGGIMNISNLATGLSVGGYGDFTTTDTVSQMRTNTVNFSSVYTGGTFGTKVWVDWNQDGQFDISEIVSPPSSYSASTSGSFTVPATAVLGATRMRIGVNYNSGTGPANACLTNITGEYEDYTFIVIALPECSGQPIAGSVTTPMAVCSGITFNLATTGSTTPSNNLNGIWQSSPAGANTWTDIVGSISSNYSLTGGVTSATDYRYILNCANSGLADTSSILSVTLKAVSDCPCKPTYSSGCSGNDMIEDFSIVGENSTSIIDLATGCSGGYDDRTSLAAVDLLQGNSYTSLVKTKTTGDKCAIWIDFNDNGIFESTESVGTLSTMPSNANSSVPVIISSTAQTGLHRMRVMVGYGGTPTTYDPCNVVSPRSYGETHDYKVNILCATTLSVDLGLDTAYCIGSTFNLTLDAENAGETYLWNDGSTNQTLDVTTAGTYSVTVTNASGCSAMDAIIVTENALPVVDLGVDTSYCVGSTFTLTLDAGNTGSTYLWNDNSTNQTLSVTTANTYSVTVKDANKCVASDMIVITENALPVVDLGVDTSFCAGSSLTLDAGNVGSTYLWSDNSTNQTLSVTSAMTYAVTVKDANKCEASDIIIVSENALPVVDLGVDTSYCAGSSLTLDADNAGFTYTWNDNSTNQTLSVNTAGTYSVTVKDANQCESSDTIVITENALPVVDLGMNASLCAGSTLTLDADNAGSSYLWNDNSANQTLVVTSPGTYSVTVTDANICSASDTIVITAGAIITAGNLTSSANGNCEFDFGITGVANVDSYAWNFGDGATTTTTTAFASHSFVAEGSYTVIVVMSNDCGIETRQINVTCDRTGVNDVASEKLLTLYPNPTAANITIENSGNLNMEMITVIDNLGKVVYQSNPMSTMNYQLNVSSLSNGLYTVMIKTDKGVITKKFEVLK